MPHWKNFNLCFCSQNVLKTLKSINTLFTFSSSFFPWYFKTQKFTSSFLQFYKKMLLYQNKPESEFSPRTRAKSTNLFWLQVSQFYSISNNSVSKLWKAIKSYQNYERVSKQEELDVFLQNLKKYITNKLIYFSRILKNTLWLYHSYWRSKS